MTVPDLSGSPSPPPQPRKPRAWERCSTVGSTSVPRPSCTARTGISSSPPRTAWTVTRTTSCSCRATGTAGRRTGGGASPDGFSPTRGTRTVTWRSRPWPSGGARASRTSSGEPLHHRYRDRRHRRHGHRLPRLPRDAGPLHRQADRAQPYATTRRLSRLQRRHQRQPVGQRGRGGRRGARRARAGRGDRRHLVQRGARAGGRAAVPGRDGVSFRMITPERRRRP